MHKIDTELQARALKVIPNGMYGHESVRLLPAGYPQFFTRAEGAHLWDADGNRYLDFMCAYGPNLLGYGHPEVEAAARRQAALGDTMTGPAPVMVDLAEQLVALVDHADWALFCKNGTDATTMAVSVARAHTGRRAILVANGAYHGAAPWCTPVPAGTTAADRANIHHYRFNDIAQLEAQVAELGADLAAILVSPYRHDAFTDQELPDPAFLRRVRQLCDESGALLIVDEVRAGLRLARGSSWTELGVKPDLSAWGKCIANGYPISALLGRESCRTAAGALYVTGSFWFSAVPMAAAIATLRIVRNSDYLEKIVRLGTRLRAGLADAAGQHGFVLHQTGPVQMPEILFADDPDLRTGCAWVSEMLARGFYVHPWHNMFLCAAMTDADIEAAIDAAGDAFAAVASRRGQLQPHPLIAAMLHQRHEG